jgi:hypothetical protein
MTFNKSGYRHNKISKRHSKNKTNITIKELNQRNSTLETKYYCINQPKQVYMDINLEKNGLDHTIYSHTPLNA